MIEILLVNTDTIFGNFKTCPLLTGKNL